MLRRVGLACMLILLAAGAVAAEEEIINVVRQVRPAVVTVITYDSAGVKISQGTGFYVDATHVVTDFHVVKDAIRMEVKGPDGLVIAVKEVSAGNEQTDVASLLLKRPNTEVKPLTVVSTIPELGERVVVVGSPYGLEATVTDGIVSAVRDLPELGHVIQISAPISRGSSGSPVVNMKGEVVGVAQAIHSDGQNLNFAIPGSQVLALRPGSSRTIASVPAGEAAGPSSKSMDDAYDRGYILFRDKKYDEALPYFLETTKLDPRHYLAWFSAGHCYVQTGQYKLAASAFMKSVKIKTDFLEGYCSLGAALGLMGRHGEAIEVFKIAVKLKPDSGIAHYGLGLEYMGAGDKDSATREYRLLKTLDPGLASELGEVIY